MAIQALRLIEVDSNIIILITDTLKSLANGGLVDFNGTTSNLLALMEKET